MTRDGWKKRLQALEGARRMRDAPVEILHINFVRADGTREEPTVACGPDDFVCERGADESVSDFEERADDECLDVRDRSMPPPILVFMSD
jgi:hypothetical protein